MRNFGVRVTEHHEPRNVSLRSRQPTHLGRAGAAIWEVEGKHGELVALDPKPQRFHVARWAQRGRAPVTVDL
jgi:hypothetical protein